MNKIPQIPLPTEKIPASTHYALFMLMLIYAFNFLDRQILVILQEPIKAELGLSDGQLGLLTGFAFAVFYVAAGLPIAYWADRGNRRNIISLSLLVWSAMTAVSGFAQSFTQLLLARIGVGVGEAGGTPPAHAMISDYYPKHKRAMALSIYSGGLYLGIMVGFLLGGVLGATYGWRTALFAVGIPGIILAFIFKFTVKEPVRGYWSGQHLNENAPTMKETVRFLANNSTFWYMAMGCGLSSLVAYGVGNFAPSFLLRSHSVSLLEVGTYLALILGISGVVGTFFSGWCVDKLAIKDERWTLWLPAIATLLSVPFHFMSRLTDDITLVWLGIFMYNTLYCMFLAPCVSMAHSLVPVAMRALSSSILYFVLNIIGLGLGPISVGFLSDYFMSNTSWGDESMRYAQLVVMLVTVPAALMFFLAARKLPASSAKVDEAKDVVSV